MQFSHFYFLDKIPCILQEGGKLHLCGLIRVGVEILVWFHVLNMNFLF